MNGAPPGFIPLDGDVIVAVRGITSVKQSKERVIDPAYEVEYYQAMHDWYAANPDSRPGSFRNSGFKGKPRYLADRFMVEIEAGTLRGVKRGCSLVQFSAKMIEAMEESNGT